MVPTDHLFTHSKDINVLSQQTRNHNRQVSSWCVHWPQQVPERLTESSASLWSASRINLRSEGNTLLSLNQSLTQSLMCDGGADYRLQIIDYRLQITNNKLHVGGKKHIHLQVKYVQSLNSAGERRVSYLASPSVDVFLWLILKLRLLSSVGGASAMNEAVRWVLKVESLHVYIHLLLTRCSASCWWFTHLFHFYNRSSTFFISYKLYLHYYSFLK